MSGDKVIFGANDGPGGYEPWVTDGTAAGTYVLADTDAGGGVPHRQYFTALGDGEVLFVAGSTDIAGGELWVTNGTSAGTYALNDIFPGGGAYPRDVTAIGNGEALFQAQDGTHGYELWITNGTLAGTSLLKDIYPGGGSSDPKNFVPLGNGEVVFSATDGSLPAKEPDNPYHGTELWVTNGTAAGTSLLKDIYPGPTGSSPSYITAIGNGEALFSAYTTVGEQLFITDGTAAGTSIVLEFAATGKFNFDPKFFTPLGNGEVVFQGYFPVSKTQLWVTDGTATGTNLVELINSGGGAYPNDITAIGDGKAVFAANQPGNGYELWVTNGTAAGTYMVKDINPGSASSNPHDITSLGNGEAVFSANDGTPGVGEDGYQLWVTNGTASGTSIVTVINPGISGPDPRSIAAIGNGEAMFSANDGTHGYELWVTNGTAAGTSMVKDIYPGSASSNPAGFVLDVSCFGFGTAIATPHGEMAVQALAVGDTVSLADGGVARVAWIGWRKVDATRHPVPGKIWPVRIAAGAFGGGLPHRDLWLSPDHAVLVEDSLIPVKCLINSDTIVQVPVDGITYYHIELPHHDVLLAEGLAVESYLDTGNRSVFSNAGGVVRLHPDLASLGWEALGCAPLIVTGPHLDAARANLAMIAANLTPKTADAA